MPETYDYTLIVLDLIDFGTHVIVVNSDNRDNATGIAMGSIAHKIESDFSHEELFDKLLVIGISRGDNIALANALLGDCSDD